MANWDSADLLQRFKDLTNRPLIDEAITDAKIYSLLGDAQLFWVELLAVQCPWLLLTAPTKMLTADNGLTYTFPNGVTPMKAEIYDAPGGRKMIPGAAWSAASDYIWEGNKIRFPLAALRTFADGPYARYIVPPGVLDAGNAPTLTPDYARALLAPRAAIIWARRGGFRDPQPYVNEENDIWYGEPQRGKIGLLGMFKTQNPDAGAAAIRREQGLTGIGYFLGRQWS